MIFVSDLDGDLEHKELMVDRHISSVALEDNTGFCRELDLHELHRLEHIRWR